MTNGFFTFFLLPCIIFLANAKKKRKVTEMKRTPKRKLYITAALILIFAIWTVAVFLFDTDAVGPLETSVGFATLNIAFFETTGVNLILYEITDAISILPLGAAFVFFLLGLTQLIKRKKLKSVDEDILILGVFYFAVVSVFLIFEAISPNFRPILIDGELESSYPSSTTMLFLTVMPSSATVLNKRIKNSKIKLTITCLVSILSAFAVIARLISGVHWLSDIIGGILISAALLMAFYTAISAISTNKP